MLKLLIVEDVRTVREALRHAVDWNAMGIRLQGTAANGEEALALIRQEAPDLLLTDIGMPRMNGLELIGKVKERYPDIRCIILSGLNEFEHARQAIKLQVLEYILKPVNPEEINRVMTSAVDDLRRQQEERREKAAAEQVIKGAMPNLAETLSLDEWTGGMKKKKLVERAIDYMKSSCNRKELTLSDIAAAAGISDKYLNTLVKEITGMTVSQMMIRLRMEEAALLLKDPVIRIYEICERIGYADQDHFRETFKKQYGLTPTEYRNRLL